MTSSSQTFDDDTDKPSHQWKVNGLQALRRPWRYGSREAREVLLDAGYKACIEHPFEGVG